jgi:signal transduction histidine kinase
VGLSVDLRWRPTGLGPYETVRARHMHVSLSVGIGVSAVSGLILIPFPRLWWVIVAAALSLGVLSAALVLLHRSQTRWAARLALWFPLLSTCVSGFWRGGVDTGLPLYLFSYAFAGLLWLPLAEAVALAVSCAVVLVAWTFATPAPGLEATAAELALGAFSMVTFVGFALEALGATQDAAAKRTADAERAQREADEASRAKMSFLAMMSHELRTPLNAILGYTGLLREDGVGRRDAELGQIEVSGATLLGLVDDVLELARAESRELDLERIELVALLEGILAASGGVIRVAHGAEVSVRSDRRTLRRLLVRLLEPGRFEDPSLVHVCVEPSATTAILRVTDPLGVQADALALGVVSGSASSVGRTVGHTLAQRLAERVGARLSVSPAPEGGAIVRLKLPVAP